MVVKSPSGRLADDDFGREQMYFYLQLFRTRSSEAGKVGKWTEAEDIPL